MGDGYAVKLSPLYFTFTYEKRVHQVFCPAKPMVFPLFFLQGTLYVRLFRQELEQDIWPTGTQQPLATQTG